MPRPGVDVNIMDEPVQAEANLDPSQGFMAGNTERGRVGMCQSFTEFKKKYGGRNSDTMHLYDAARGFFEESGGATLYISPINGDTAAESEADLGTFLHVNARGAGLWGDDIEVKTIAPTSMTEQAMGGVVYQVNYGTAPDVVEVERSPALITIDQAIDWSERMSSYVIFSPYTGVGGTDTPTAGATAELTGGVDDPWDMVDDTVLAPALEQFPYELGPGQVQVPGSTEVGTCAAVAQHTLDTYRVGLFDLPDDPDPNDMALTLGQCYDFPGIRNMLGVGPFVSYPHETSPATILIPPSGVQSGIIARCDKLGDPALSAAGVDGYSARALGLSQSFADGDREELNGLGASLYKEVYGQVRMYGYRTMAGPNETNWLFFQESRVIMMIAHEANAVLEEFVLKTMDGKKHILSRVNTALTGVCSRFWVAGALYGEAAGDAFRIDTESPNSLVTMANGELHANILLKTSKLAEWIVLNLVKYRTERPLPVAA
jgi:hypothetical protein